MKTRLDQLLVDRGLAETRERAQRIIRAGLALVDEHRVDKPGLKFPDDCALRVKENPCPYVSRGGLKLAGALDRFGPLDLAGFLALDIGASTGGFSDCLLRRGAAHVWAIDTGRGQLHESLRREARLTLREQANARFLAPDWVGGQRMDLIVIDVSFISLRLILPPLAAVSKPGGWVIALIKPQFEAGPRDVGRGGVVRDRLVHRRVLHEIAAFARAQDWQVLGLCPSPLPGPAGNWEFFIWLGRQTGRPALDEAGVEIAVEQALDEIYNQSGDPAGDGPGRAGEKDEP